eukprot:GHUV01010172.1.p1 GENE.GHUV01010172.1~~GHUV01010172.1.p1  ORF type:complete len:404 (+),score=84.90 GHUV01010172.1:227-1438(+)
MSDVSITAGDGASAGGGLLVTRLDPPWLQLAGCPKGTSLNSTTISCLQQASAQCSGPGIPTRPLLPADAAATTVGIWTAAAGPAGPNVSSSTATDFVVTSAAAMRCRRFVSMTNSVKWFGDDCAKPVRAGPGVPIDVAVQLFDGLGRPVSNGMYDATMPTAVAVLFENGTRSNFLLIGNRTQAVDGSAYFPGLTIYGLPGDQYQLVFSSLNRQNVTLTRRLVIRECQAGESTVQQSVGSDSSTKCEMCNSPLYSFYPQAPVCGQCALLGNNLYDLCNLAAVVPANGVYQSHPRSPLLHRCITAAACSRNSTVQQAMADWAAEHASMTITQLNEKSNGTGLPYYQPYVANMCSSGYTGPLCGACAEGFGHSGQRCVKCMHHSTNSFIYFLVCLFIIIIIHTTQP